MYSVLFYRRRSRAHIERILSDAEESGTLGITRRRLSSELKLMVPSLLDVTALDPPPDIILSGLEPTTSNGVVIARMVKDYHNVVANAEEDKCVKRTVRAQMINIRKLCVAVYDDIKVVSDAASHREQEQAEGFKQLEKTEMGLKSIQPRIQDLENDNARVTNASGLMKEELQSLKKQRDALQEGKTPHENEIVQLKDLHQETHDKNIKQEKDLVRVERNLIYGQHKLQLTKNNQKQLVKDLNKLRNSSFTHQNVEKAHAQEGRYWLICKLFATILLAMIIYLLIKYYM